jgi:GT2 family glycosyltransferase
MTEPKLFGVLVTFRRPAALALMLDRLAEEDQPLELLVVVDNAPSARARQLVDVYRARDRRVVYIATSENLGPAGGRAVGMGRLLMTAADADWIVCLDDDEPPSSGELTALVRFAEQMVARDSTTGAVGASGGRFDLRRGLVVRVPDDELIGPISVDSIGGGQLPLYRVKAIRRAGAFSPDLFFGFEELELGMRLREHGYSLYADGVRWRERRERGGRLGLDPRPSHNLGPVTSRRYYSLRNLIYVLRMHRKPSTALRVALLHGVVKPLANLLVSPRCAIRHLRLNIRAISDAWRGRMGRTVEPESREKDNDHQSPPEPIGASGMEVRA